MSTSIPYLLLIRMACDDAYNCIVWLWLVFSNQYIMKTKIKEWEKTSLDKKAQVDRIT